MARSPLDRSKRPRSGQQADKAKPVKQSQSAAKAESEESAAVGATEASSEGTDFSHSISRGQEKNAEAWVPESKAEREEKTSKAEEAEEEEKAEEGDSAKAGGKTQPRSPLARKPPPGLARRGPSDGFEQRFEPLKQPLQQPVRTAAAMASTPIAAALPPPPSTSRPGKPPDAMSVLHSAKEAGVYFKEDAHREGHSEEQDDPELAAAVEATIQLLFGVRGIHRVGPGRDEANEPVVVVVASRGFGEASMQLIPEKVHRFRTLLALPYELLPLRRER